MDTHYTSTGQAPEDFPPSSGASTHIYASSTDSGDTPPGSGLSTSYTSTSTASLSYSVDPSAGTRTMSFVMPTGGSAGIVAASSSNTGAVAGGIIAAFFVLFLIGFVIYRYASARRRRNRIAPSTRYLAEVGPRPLSWGHFFADRGSSYTVTNVGDSQPDVTLDVSVFVPFYEKISRPLIADTGPRNAGESVWSNICRSYPWTRYFIRKSIFGFRSANPDRRL